jgi:hypothetical protein
VGAGSVNLVWSFDAFRPVYTLYAFNPFWFICALRLFDSLDSFDSLYPHTILENLDPYSGFQAVIGFACFDPLATFQVAGSGLLSPLDFLPRLAIVVALA